MKRKRILSIVMAVMMTLMLNFNFITASADSSNAGKNTSIHLHLNGDTGDVYKAFVIYDGGARVEMDGNGGKNLFSTSDHGSLINPTVNHFEIQFTTASGRPAGTYVAAEYDTEGGGTANYDIELSTWTPPVVTGTLTVKYVDSNGKNLEDPTTTEQPIGTEYTTVQKSFSGYTFVNVTGNATGAYTNDPITVTYNYKQNEQESKGTLTVKYVDNNGKNLEDPTITEQPIGTEYTTVQKSFSGYTFVNVTGNATGAYTNDPITVTYNYKQNGTLTVKYVDNNGKNLEDPTTTEQPIGTEYTTVQKSFSGYTFVSVTGNATGTYTNDPITVTYNYKQNEQESKGTLTVKYVDSNGNNLEDPTTTKQPIGTEYTTVQKSFSGYTFVSVTENATGTYIDGTITVTYTYKKTEKPQVFTGTLIVKYVDTNNNNIINPETTTAVVGTYYTTVKESFEGYTLVSVTGNAAGSYVYGTTTVTYIYKHNETLTPVVTPTTPPVITPVVTPPVTVSTTTPSAIATDPTPGSTAEVTTDTTVTTPASIDMPKEVTPGSPVAIATKTTPKPIVKLSSEVTPGGPAQLPKTGGIPETVFYGFGASLIALGLVIRKINK